MKSFADLDPRFQHLGLKVGSFLVLLVVLLLVMAGVLLWRQDLLVSSVDFRVRPDRADAIQQGMDVTLHGIRVGRVASLRLGEDGLPEMELRVREESVKWIYADAAIRLSGLDFFNTPFLSILPGNPVSGPVPENAVLPFEREMTLGEIASKIQAQVSPVIEEAASFLHDLKRPDGDVLASLASLRALSGALEKDVPALLSESRGAAASARALLDEMASESGDVRTSAARVESMTAELEKRLPTLLDHTRRTLASAEASAKILEKTLASSSDDLQLTVRKSGAVAEKADTLMEDVRKIWLLKMMLPRNKNAQPTPSPTPRP